ncbi:predicted protein [Lichtheimia corymbifera JMRC:FSU:9682]|uniref:Uncharacterized protein n=1 Tax=Lichtheimia corymbifera JMRC:FSU:9682 TaxID=1263082 RepID=A0A068RYJ3_9FUNG|nr:predicted protein [Lichtheimia corymbifera JMRC:FSU:9682]
MVVIVLLDSCNELSLREASAKAGFGTMVFSVSDGGKGQWPPTPMVVIKRLPQTQALELFLAMTYQTRKIAKSIVKQLDPASKEPIVNQLKDQIRLAKLSADTKLKKAVVKSLNVYRRQFKHGRSLLEREQTEGNYIETFLCPVFDKVFGDVSEDILMSPTKNTLQVAAGFISC